MALRASAMIRPLGYDSAHRHFTVPGGLAREIERSAHRRRKRKLTAAATAGLAACRFGTIARCWSSAAPDCRRFIDTHGRHGNRHVRLVGTDADRTGLHVEGRRLPTLAVTPLPVTDTAGASAGVSG